MNIVQRICSDPSEVKQLFFRFEKVIRNKMRTFANINGENHIRYWPRNEPKDIKAAEMVLEENKELAIEKWNEYFGGSVKDEDY